MNPQNTLTQQAVQEVHSLADNDADSKDSDIRYMAYASRLRTALRAGSRYVAYVRAATMFPVYIFALNLILD